MASYSQQVTVNVYTPGATPSLQESTPDSSGRVQFLVDEGPVLDMHIGQSASIQAYGSRQVSMPAAIDAGFTGNPATEADRLIIGAEAANVTWASSNTAMVTVSAASGNPISVTAVSSGTCVVTATYSSDNALQDSSITVEVGSPG